MAVNAAIQSLCFEAVKTASAAAVHNGSRGAISPFDSFKIFVILMTDFENTWSQTTLSSFNLWAGRGRKGLEEREHDAPVR